MGLADGPRLFRVWEVGRTLGRWSVLGALLECKAELAAGGQSWGGMPGERNPTSYEKEAFRNFYKLLGVGFAQAPWVVLIRMRWFDTLKHSSLGRVRRTGRPQSQRKWTAGQIIKAGN